MTRARSMLAVCFALTILGAPAWAGSIGLQFGSGGKVVFKGGSNPLAGTTNVTDVTFGKERLPATGSFSFMTGKLYGMKTNEWLFGAGGKFTFSGCVDIDLDHDKKCDKKDLKGTLLTGDFKSAELFKTGKNTFTLDGQIWVILCPALARQFGISSVVPYLANFSLNFVGGVHSGKIHSTNVLGGSLAPTPVPEPTALVLLGFGAVLATFIHTMLRARSAEM